MDAEETKKKRALQVVSTNLDWDVAMGRADEDAAFDIAELSPKKNHGKGGVLTRGHDVALKPRGVKLVAGTRE